MRDDRFFTLETESKNLFYKVPKVFTLEGSKYFEMSPKSKLLYAILSDRHSLSVHNQWTDNKGRIFFLFNQIELCKVAGFKSPKTLREHIKELVKYNLLYREKQGFSEPDRLYLLQVEITEKQTSVLMGKNYLSDGEKLPISMGKNYPADGEKLPPNKTNTNKTNTNKTNTTQFNACSSENGLKNKSLLEKKTHLKITKNQLKKIEEWETNRLDKTIDIFLEKKGKYFSLIEKIYMDNGNFAPKDDVPAKSKDLKFNNFESREYDYDSLEKKLLGWEE